MNISAKVFSIGLVAILAFSCKNKKNDVGVDVLPSDDILTGLYTDTVTVRAITVLDDSLASDELSSTYIGSYNDPVFGTVDASAFFQFRFQNNIANLNIVDSIYGIPQFDSAVLSMPYNAGAYYGSLDQQTFGVYELTQSMYRDSTYYTYRKFAHDSMNPLGTLTFVPKPTDNLIIGGDTLEPAIRIRLSDPFGQNLIDQYGKTPFSNSDELVKFFKGLYVKSENGSQMPSTGALLGINAASDKIKLILYHRIKKKKTSITADSTITLSLVVNASSARCNHIKHNYATASTSEVLSQLTNPNPLNQKMYVQGLAGLSSKIMFPYIANFNNEKPTGISKAELVIKVDPTNGTSLAVPSSLGLAWIDSLGGLNELYDQLDMKEDFGGVYNSTTQEYSFIISRHLQQILSGSKPNYGLMLVSAGRQLTPNRVILGNNSNTAGSKMYLKLVYTKL